MSLFPDEWFENAKKRAKAQAKLFKEDRPKGHKCSNCKHMIRHPYTIKLNYCRLGKSNRTENGMASTKRSAWCAKWEARKS